MQRKLSVYVVSSTSRLLAHMRRELYTDRGQPKNAVQLRNARKKMPALKIDQGMVQYTNLICRGRISYLPGSHGSLLSIRTERSQSESSQWLRLLNMSARVVSLPSHKNRYISSNRASKPISRYELYGLHGKPRRPAYDDNTVLLNSYGYGI